MRKTFIVQAREKRLILGARTLLMGIVNASPDSFSGDGRASCQAAVRLGLRHLSRGASILDVGGESTRPGASEVSAQEEIRRIIPVIQALRRRTDLPISVDSYKPETILTALDAGADIVNLIKGTPVDKRILRYVRDHHAAIILMHMRGTPETMQTKTRYKDIIDEISVELKKSVEKCLETGITRDKIILDPGIGFAKTTVQNLFLLKHLSRFTRLGFPLLVGTSRKSFIGKVLGADVQHRRIPTVATGVWAAINGAHILRVHDVQEHDDALTMTDAITAATI